MAGLPEGFGERSGGGQFWNVKNGLLCKRCDETTEGAVRQTKKDGSVYYEIQKPNFTGRLKKVEVREHEEYGKFLALHFVANDQPVKIEMNFDSGYAFGFLSTIPSADISGRIMIAPFYKEQDGKKESKIFIKDEKCDGKSWCKQYFTKETPNGLPELEKVSFKGKETWDNTKRLEYFENVLIPKLNGGLEKIWGSSECPTPEKVKDSGDDLPF